MCARSRCRPVHGAIAWIVPFGSVLSFPLLLNAFALDGTLVSQGADWLVLPMVERWSKFWKTMSDRLPATSVRFLFCLFLVLCFCSLVAGDESNIGKLFNENKYMICYIDFLLGCSRHCLDKYQPLVIQIGFSSHNFKLKLFLKIKVINLTYLCLYS